MKRIAFWMMVLMLGAAAGCAHKDAMTHGGMMDKGEMDQGMMKPGMSDEGMTPEGMTPEGMATDESMGGM